MNGPIFLDAEGYHGSKGAEITIQTIIMQQIERISRLASTEWHGGFWYQTGVATLSTGAGTTVPQSFDRYMPAANEAYSNAVACLADLLSPFYDAAIKEYEDGHQEKLTALRKEVDAWFKEQKLAFDKVVWYDKKVWYMRRFFRELVQFVKRSDLMRGDSYEVGAGQ